MDKLKIRKYRIYISISKISIIIILLFLFGTVSCYRGITSYMGYINMISEIKPFQISEGQYLELEISPDDIMREMVDGKLLPLYATVSYANDHRYMIGTDDKSYYIALIVPKAYQKDFTAFLKSKSNYYFTGKVEKLKSELSYRGIMNCLNIKREDIEKVVDTKYFIKIVNIKNEKRILYMGVCMVVSSIMLFFISSVEFEK